MKRLIPTLTDHFIPVVIERVQEVISSLIVPFTPNVDEVDPLVSEILIDVLNIIM